MQIFQVSLLLAYYLIISKHFLHIILNLNADAYH